MSDGEGHLSDFISGIRVKATPEEVGAVQPFLKRLVEDFDYPKNRIISHPQYRVRRSPGDESRSYPVDIAVFASDDTTNDDDLLLIVECKKPKRKDGIAQLKIYLDLCPAKLGAWYNGHDHSYLQKMSTRGGVNTYREIPSLPRNGQRIDDIGLFLQRDLRPTVNLSAIFRDIANHIAGNAKGPVMEQAIASEIVNLLFCKIYDELNTADNEILEFRSGVNEAPIAVGRRIRSLFDHVKAEYADVFTRNDEITIDDKSLTHIVGELQMYRITSAQRDVIGEAFEVFVGPALKGSEGQFFTPRNVVRTAIEIVDPGTTDKILDPACGSGGFLIVALEHVWNKVSKEASRRHLSKAWLRKEEGLIAQRNFRGIDKDFFLAKVTKAYMAIVGDGRGGVFCENSLEPFENWSAPARTAIEPADEQGAFDVILTNPPFGAKITVDDPGILRQFSLAHVWRREPEEGWTEQPKMRDKQAPQILFIERCHQLLRPGGKLAIVLPDGVLGGSKVGYVPHWIKLKFEVLALVDCPVETFSPHTTTKVHLLVLRKKDATRTLAKRTFMSEPRVIGHDKKGHPVWTDETRTAVHDDLEETVRLWRRFTGGEDVRQVLGFSVASDELENFLNAKRYLPEFMEVLRVIKVSRSQKRSLAELCAKMVTGANVDNLDYVDSAEDGGRPYVLVKNIQDEGINVFNVKYIRAAVAEHARSATAQTGDLIINRCGDAGVAAVIPSDLHGAVICGFCFLLRIKRGFDANYVSAFLNSRLGRLQMKRLAIGSVLEHITKEDLKGVQVLFPDDERLSKEIGDHFHAAIEFRVKAREKLRRMDALLVDMAKSDVGIERGARKGIRPADKRMPSSYPVAPKDNASIVAEDGVQYTAGVATDKNSPNRHGGRPRPLRRPTSR